MTARHVLVDAVSSVQRPWPRHAASALPEFVPRRQDRIQIEPTNLRAVWMGPAAADFCLISHAHYADRPDIAICLIAMQEHTSADAIFSTFALDTSIPNEGDQVVLVSSSAMKLEEHGTSAGDAGKLLRISKNVCARMGSITAVYPSGHRQFKWPCFSTSIPAEPGMSGGLIYRAIDGAPIAACGVVSADCSPEQARNDFTIAGNSIAAMIWPSVGFRVPESLPTNEHTKHNTLLDLIRAGEIKDVGDGLTRLSIIAGEDCDYVVHRRL
jgi:hypothetical protein